MPRLLMRSVLKGNAMSKITPEQIRAAAEDACNKGFPYFKHGESSTPPNDLTEDLDAALKIGEVLPDCFESVSCNTSGNVLGHFAFKGYFRPSETLEVELTLVVDRYGAELSSTHLADFFKLYVLQEPREIPVIPTTYNEVVNREG